MAWSGQRVGAATSVHRDPAIAARSAMRAALKQCGLTRPEFVLAFATTTYDQAALVRALNDLAGGAPLAGCSGESVIGPKGDVESTHALAVQVWGSGDVRARAAVATDAAVQPEAAAAGLAEQLRELDVRSVLCFADAHVDWPLFRSTLIAKLGDVSILGGLAAGTSPLEPAYQYGREAATGAVSALGLVATIDVACSATACAAVGRWLKTTRRDGMVIHELDGRAAADVVAEAIGSDCVGRDGEAPPGLALLVEDSMRATLIKRIDLSRGSIEVASSVPGGIRVCVAIPDGERIRANYRRLAANTVASRGVIQIESTGTTDGVVPRKERAALLENLRARRATTAWIGFRGYGEIHSRGMDDRNAHTTTLVAIL